MLHRILVHLNPVFPQFISNILWNSLFVHVSSASHWPHVNQITAFYSISRLKENFISGWFLQHLNWLELLKNLRIEKGGNEKSHHHFSEKQLALNIAFKQNHKYLFDSRWFDCNWLNGRAFCGGSFWGKVWEINFIITNNPLVNISIYIDIQR